MVGLIDDKSLTGLKVIFKDMTTQEISLYPGVMNAVRSELATVFKEVKVVGSAKEAKDAEMVVYPTIVPNLRNAHTVDLSLRLSFRDQETKDMVAEFSQTRTIASFGITGGTLIAAVVTGLTLFLASPITMPIIGTSQRDDAIEDFEEVVPQMLRVMSADIRRDKRITGR